MHFSLDATHASAGTAHLGPGSLLFSSHAHLAHITPSSRPCPVLFPCTSRPLPARFPPAPCLLPALSLPSPRPLPALSPPAPRALPALFSSPRSAAPGAEPKSIGRGKTTEINTVTHAIEEAGVKIKLSITDTPGFGDQVDNSRGFEPILGYIKEQFDAYLSTELSIQAGAVLGSC